MWTYQTLITKGHPAYRVMLADVDTVEAVDPRRVTFRFKSNTDRTLPLTVAGLSVLPEKWWTGKDFERPTLEPLLGNGAYRMAEVQPGRTIIWERVKDYWAADLPIVRGTSNFDRVQVDYYRDQTVIREAFKAGLIDVFEESTAAEWHNSYDFPAVKQGLVIKREVKHDVPQGMQRFVFNMRRPLFQDIRVREALGYALDFQWYNKTYFYDSVQALQELLEQLRARLQRPAGGRRAGPRWSAIGAVCPRRCSTPCSIRRTTLILPPSATGCARRSGCSRRQAGATRATGWSTTRPASRSSSSS